MPWTGEDTKDVFKKVLGGLIAAAVVAIIYAVMEEMPWYFAAFLGVGLFVLVILLMWRLSVSKASDGKTHEPSVDSPPSSVAEAKPDDPLEASPAHGASAEEARRDFEPNEKMLKKLAKAEAKRRKKEAKSEEKKRE